MRKLLLLAMLSSALPAAAYAGEGTRTGGDQAQKVEQKRSSWQCNRDKDHPVRESTSKVDCKINRPLPPVIDPTPIFLP